MAKDYAKYTGKNRKPAKKKGRLLDLWILSLLMLLIGGTSYWIYKFTFRQDLTQSHAMTELLADMDEVLHHKYKTSDPLQAAKKSPTVTAEKDPEVEFNFYNELPNMQVTVPTPPPESKEEKSAMKKITEIKKG